LSSRGISWFPCQRVVGSVRRWEIRDEDGARNSRPLLMLVLGLGSSVRRDVRALRLPPGWLAHSPACTVSGVSPTLFSLVHSLGQDSVSSRVPGVDLYQ
jgi:hypothetical protein